MQFITIKSTCENSVENLPLLRGWAWWRNKSEAEGDEGSQFKFQLLIV